MDVFLLEPVQENYVALTLTKRFSLFLANDYGL